MSEHLRACGIVLGRIPMIVDVFRGNVSSSKIYSPRTFSRRNKSAMTPGPLGTVVSRATGGEVTVSPVTVMVSR